MIVTAIVLSGLLAASPASPRPPFEAEIDAAIADVAGVYPVPKALVFAVISVESAFDPRAVSRAGAVGLMHSCPPPLGASESPPTNSPTRAATSSAAFASSLFSSATTVATWSLPSLPTTHDRGVSSLTSPRTAKHPSTCAGLCRECGGSAHHFNRAHTHSKVGGQVRMFPALEKRRARILASVPLQSGRQDSRLPRSLLPTPAPRPEPAVHGPRRSTRGK